MNCHAKLFKQFQLANLIILHELPQFISTPLGHLAFIYWLIK